MALHRRVNRHAARPLYRQVSDDLADGLRRLAPGDRLPSETDLAAEYDVNRLTVRHALAELTRRGLVDTVHGRGTFVAAPPIRYDVSSGDIASFSQAMRAAGHDVDVRLLRVGGDDDPELRRALRTRRPALRFDLIRLVDAVPWSLTATWLPASRFRGIERHWKGDTSLYELLAARYGVHMHRGERTFTARPADAVDAEHLAVPFGAPILEVRGRNIGGRGETVAVVHHRFRGDRVQYTVGPA